LFYIDQDHQQLGAYTDKTSNLEVFNKDYVKAKGNKSRDACFKLLLTLCKDNQKNLEILVKEGMLKLLDNIEIVQKYGYHPSKN